jgi:anti-sigma factor RsiW
MCPDRDLVSAFVDGEVPSPWRERLEEHLASCAKCAALASSYAALGDRLRAELVADEAASLARGRTRLDTLLAGMPGPGAAIPPAIDEPRAGALAGPRAWRGSVSLPLPLAAAAALLVLLLGGATTILAFKSGRGAAIQAIASGEIAPPPQAKAQPASMDELLRYLDANDAQVTLTIKLPSGTSFGSAGNPVIMRAGQVVRPQASGTTVGGQAP